MSLSPSYAARILTPEQPRPPAHWPQECAEVMSHAWHRLFRCDVAGCGKVHEFLLDELDADSVPICYGDGVTTVRVEG